MVVGLMGVGTPMRLIVEFFRQSRISLTARCMLRHLGELRLARIAGVWIAIEFGLMAVPPSWYFLPPACFLAVFGFCALHNTSQINATQLAPKLRCTAVSLFARNLPLGQSLGVLCAAWLVDYYTASAAFSVLAIGLLVLGLTFAVPVNQRGRL